MQQRETAFVDVLEGVRAVGERVAERAAEIDDKRSIPEDLYDELEETRVFDALTPKELGGLGLSMRQVAEIIVEGARANGSLGWLLMIGSAQGIGFGKFNEDSVRHLLKEFPRLRSRGVFAPKGVAVPKDDGYVISGQWPFASGGPNPHFMSGNCMVHRDGKPSMLPEGPEMIMALMPADQLEPIDTWYTLGMRGTDSRDYAARDVFVPQEMTLDIYTAKSFYDTPAARLPTRVALAAPHAAVAVGIAQGALDDITGLAKTKRAAMNPSALLADDAVFRHTLGEQTLRLTSARSMLYHLTEQLESWAAEGQPLSPTDTLIGRSMAAYVTHECVKVVDAAYTFGGSEPVYEGSSLQRRLRDIHVATQHIAASPEAYRVLAAAVLGEELSPRELF